jgi:hypothetical protein
MWSLDLGQIQKFLGPESHAKGEHIREVWGLVGNPKDESADVSTTEELIQKP